MLLVVALSVPLGRDGVSPQPRSVDGVVVLCAAWRRCGTHASLALEVESDLISEEQPLVVTYHETISIQWLPRV